MSERQRALELRKFFAPFDGRTDSLSGQSVNQSILYDGALDAYAELVLWRLQGVRAMVTLVDRTLQYFVAGVRRQNSTAADVVADHEWFGCSTVDTPGGLCENVIAITERKDPYPCFQVPDLAADPRFSPLPVVDGSIAAYRFYVGTPITTSHGVNIGSLFIFDDQPRPEGLTLTQKRYMFETAANVMKHLESKREAVESRRIALMNTGFAKLLERTSELSSDSNHGQTRSMSTADGTTVHSSSVDPSTATSQTSTSEHDQGGWQRKKGASEIVSDKIKMTLDHAAKILRESLEITAGGVVFLDTAIGPPKHDKNYIYGELNSNLEAVTTEVETTQTDTNLVDPLLSPEADSTLGDGDSKTETPFLLPSAQLRGYHDEYRPARVPALSCSKHAYLKSGIFDSRTLHKFIDMYPRGNIWYIDENEFFSSLDQIDSTQPNISRTVGLEREGPIGDIEVDAARQATEQAVLSKVFHKARQIIFLPLWDAAAHRWHSGCFVWSNHPFPVFTFDSEVSYISALSSSVMAEISRLDSITANNMKSDFIGSISHEFRSPLHGILASAEFLQDSRLDTAQDELVSTIQTCGSTLLDTIDHILDYSLINSFEKKTSKGVLSSDLDQNVNVALLCEDVVDGIMAARGFGGTNESIDRERRGASKEGHGRRSSRPVYDSLVEIVLDFENRDWEYQIQPGALRRILINLFANARKYTETGIIIIRQQVKEAGELVSDGILTEGVKMLCLNVIDTGRGMSEQFMERKLYSPFAQEDSFAPGTGLGLSIVRSIVAQLGGRINIRSGLGQGTDVEVLLPLRPPVVKDKGNTVSTIYQLIDLNTEAATTIQMLREIAQGKTVMIRRSIDSELGRNKNLAWNTVAVYCTNWFGFIILPSHDTDELSQADLVIEERLPEADNVENIAPSGKFSRTLFLQEQYGHSTNGDASQRNPYTGTLSFPIGPFKLARSVLALFHNSPNVSDLKKTSHALLSTEVTQSNPAIVDRSKFQDTEATVPTTDTRSHSQGSHTVPSIETLTIQPYAPITQQPFTKPALVKQPLHSPQAPDSSNSISSHAVSTRPLRILAVDDNPLNLHLLTRYLKKRSQDIIVTAINGVEAVDAVKMAAVEFDLVFMDISMPLMDGFEATRLLRVFEQGGALENGNQLSQMSEQGRAAVMPKYKRAYVVALTGLGSRRDREEAVRSGFDYFLTKPVSLKTVGEIVERLSRESGTPS